MLIYVSLCCIGSCMRVLIDDNTITKQWLNRHAIVHFFNGEDVIYKQKTFLPSRLWTLIRPVPEVTSEFNLHPSGE